MRLIIDSIKPFVGEQWRCSANALSIMATDLAKPSLFGKCVKFMDKLKFYSEQERVVVASDAYGVKTQLSFREHFLEKKLRPFAVDKKQGEEEIFINKPRPVVSEMKNIQMFNAATCGEQDFYPRPQTDQALKAQKMRVTTLMEEIQNNGDSEKFGIHTFRNIFSPLRVQFVGLNETSQPELILKPSRGSINYAPMDPRLAG